MSSISMAQSDEQFIPVPLGVPRLVSGTAGIIVGGDSEVEVRLMLDSLNVYLNTADMSAMCRVPSTISDILVDKFKQLSNVRAILIGQSNDVHHVWVMIEEWTQDQRRAVYAVQKEILRTVRDFNFDFYVIDLPDGSDPGELVSGIPVVYQRA